MKCLTKHFGQVHMFNRNTVLAVQQRSCIITPGQSYCVCTGPYFTMALTNRTFLRLDLMKETSYVNTFTEGPDFLEDVICGDGSLME